MKPEISGDALDEQPDWPPRISAVGLKDGTHACGSTGQLWRVEREQWVRVKGAGHAEAQAKK
jgi:hypothetical protein